MTLRLAEPSAFEVTDSDGYRFQISIATVKNGRQVQICLFNPHNVAVSSWHYSWPTKTLGEYLEHQQPRLEEYLAAYKAFIKATTDLQKAKLAAGAS